MPPPDDFTYEILRNFLLVGAGLMALGMLGFLSRRNLIVMFLSAEMVLQGTALTLVGFGRYHGNWTGQVFTIVILTVAACEASDRTGPDPDPVQSPLFAGRDSLARYSRAGPAARIGGDRGGECRTRRGTPGAGIVSANGPLGD